ncbi:MAG TPA: hypothetical protein VGI23_15805, partial [Steroidobacteraceae bacterium]
MAIDHFAIVIGLSSYRNLGDPPPQNLQGPENDADDVLAWLKDPNGGDLPDGNIRCIRSRDWASPPNAAPTRDEIAAAFLWLDELAAENKRNGKGRTVGARLYLYASGHGFSPRAKQACLLAGNAAERQFGANVFPSAWIEWLQDADYFRECVLWMDCCMDRLVLTPPTPPPLDPILSGNAPGPSFVAFAAQRPLKAVEKPIPEDHNRWHGIFTWSLLQGLRGAAANEFGVVTGKSLGDWLRHAQWAWLDEAERINPDIAKEPAIIEDDERLVFARGLAPPPLNITLKLASGGDNPMARIWSGRPPRPGPPLPLQPTGTLLALPPGIYLAEVSAAGLRQGFTVTRSQEVLLSERGDPPLDLSDSAGNRAQTFQLAINPEDSTAAIRIVGEGFRSVDAGAGQLTSRLPSGLYEMRIQIGRQLVQKVVLLDADWPKPVSAMAAAEAVPALPMITSAAPLPDTRATHEYQRDAALAGTQRVDVNLGTGAQLMIMARGFSDSGQADPNARPWDGVVLLDPSGTVVADLGAVGQRESGRDPFVVCTFSLPPATYRLHYPLMAGAQAAQSLIVPQGGWRLEAYLMRRLDAPLQHPRVSVLMHRIGFPWGTREDTQFEKARVALADERPILGDELTALLV